MTSLNDMFLGAKDKVTGFALRTWLSLKFKRLGTMTSLKIDSKNKTIHLELDLDGEASPIQVEVRQYQLLQEDGKMFLRVDSIETSRRWINVLLAEYLVERKFEVPKAAAIAL